MIRILWLIFFFSIYSNSIYSSGDEATLNAIKRIFMRKCFFERRYSTGAVYAWKPLSFTIEKNKVTIRSELVSKRNDTLETICMDEYTFNLSDSFVVTKNHLGIELFTLGHPINIRKKVFLKTTCQIFSLPSNVYLPELDERFINSFGISTPNARIANRLYNLFKQLPNYY